MPMNRKHRQFVKHVKTHLAKHKMKLVVGKGKLANFGKGRCEGYFDENKKIIKVAGKNSAFLETLLHEYCHFLQWLQKSKIYKTADKHCLIVEQWLQGKKYPEHKVKRAFYWVRKMERECEQYAAKLIEKYELPIDKVKYIKNANCYIYAHYMMEKKRKFSTFKKSPFKSKKVQKIMPSNFRAMSHQTIPPKVYAALLSCV